MLFVFLLYLEDLQYQLTATSHFRENSYTFSKKIVTYNLRESGAIKSNELFYKTFTHQIFKILGWYFGLFNVVVKHTSTKESATSSMG